MSAGISTLPNELLTKIFLLLQDYPPIYPDRPSPFRADSSNSFSHRDWIIVTRICRQWRSVALEDPVLWSHIDVNDLGPQLTNQHLRNARMAPLAIRYSCFPSEKPTEAIHMSLEHNRFAQILCCHLDHVQRLVIRGDFQPLGAIVSCLGNPAPLLESAVVVISLDFITHQQIKVPDTLFAGHAPHLRQLELHHATISWVSLSPFTTLTHLDIRYSHLGRQVFPHPQLDMARSRASFEAFLCALERLSALQDLRLHYSIPPLASDDGQSIIIRPAVQLPNLKWLSLHLDAVIFADTMNHLTIPAHTRIELNLAIPRMRGSYDLVVPWLRSHAPNIGPMQSFVLHECWPDGVEIVAQDRCHLAPETSHLNLSDEDDEPMLRIVLRSMHRPRDFVSQIRKICDVFRLEEVKRVDVFINSWWKPQDWLDIFGRARRVEHADIGSRCASSLFDALAANCNRDHTTDLTPNDAPLLFPSLKVLELRVVDFYERVRNGGYLWERIRDKLRLRRSIAPLETLELDSCRVHAEEVDELKGLVFHVSWDEKESGYGSTDDFISESEDDGDM